MPKPGANLTPEARRRVVVAAVAPQVDGGRYPAKRVVGDGIEVSCDLVSDGHDAVAGVLRYRGPVGGAGGDAWHAGALRPLGNDRFAASFTATQVGLWEFAVEAWIDGFTTWRLATQKKLDAGQDASLELLAGALLVRAGAARAASVAGGRDAPALHAAAALLEDGGTPVLRRFAAATEAAIVEAMGRHPDLGDATRAEGYRVVVDPPRARFSAWYEMFPRSAGEGGRHGTFADCARRLPYVASMGFDVLYLPPVHPIGTAFRKGPDNAPVAGPGDVGSPWAIGAAEGGHKAVHPALGTLADFRALVDEARALGIDVAIDIAFQASPDHPYVKEHPGWFRHRADGSIQYAENPPKKYQDVYPFDFECEDWEALWAELASVFFFWCEQGVRIFRVDNPHTKPLRFWEWCLAEVKARYPDALFLAEAFTRPKLMYALARGGFSQSYTYFTWRHTKQEFTDYVTELSTPPASDFFRPNFWTNTPDILPEHLQFGGRAVFVQRLILAATLSSNYGVYGPPFELLEHVARAGTEEYAGSEKYALRAWNVDDESSLRDVIALVNRIRRENAALQDNLVTFHPTGSAELLAFSKRSRDGASVVLVVVNLDAQHTHAGQVDLDLTALGIPPGEAFQAHDVLADARYRWDGPRAYVELDPDVFPAAIFVVRRRQRTERDFDYFL